MVKLGKLSQQGQDIIKNVEVFVSKLSLVKLAPNHTKKNYTQESESKSIWFNSILIEKKCHSFIKCSLNLKRNGEKYKRSWSSGYSMRQIIKNVINILPAKPFLMNSTFVSTATKSTIEDSRVHGNYRLQHNFPILIHTGQTFYLL